MKKRAFNLIKTEAGFTLIELLVASVIFTLISLAFAYSYISGRSFLASGGDRRQATVLAQQRLEGLRAQGFTLAEPLVTTASDEDPVTGYADYQRVTQAVYLVDNNFSTVSGTATSTLRITVRVDPSTGSGLTFAGVELYSIIAR